MVSLKSPGSPDFYPGFRFLGGVINPYLVAAALLATGIDGITKKTSLPKELGENADKLSPTLAKARVALEKDKVIGDELG